MTCDQRKDLLFLYAADALEPAETDELRQHLASGCPACEGALAESRATLAQVSAALDPVAPRAQTSDALMARIGASAQAQTFPRLAGSAVAATPASPLEGPARGDAGVAATGRVRTAPSRMRIIGMSLLSAAAAIAITSAVFVSQLRNTKTELQQARTRPVPLQMVSMTSDTQPGARGTVAWDKDRNQWHVAVFNLQPITGREFELWFIPQGENKQPIPSKTFKVDSEGKATLIVDLPKDIGPIAFAAISDEPPGGMPAPTGKIHLAGKVQ